MTQRDAMANSLTPLLSLASPRGDAPTTLPEPVHSFHVNLLAESILRTAGAGERDAATLQRLALIELQLARRD